MNVEKSNEIFYISVLAVLSTFAVVFLHSNGCFWAFSKSRYWLTANIIESVFYFAVPIFFMISGATLINYKERYDTKTFFKKRIKKVVIPFLIWSIFGFLFVLFVQKTIVINDVNLLYIIKGILDSKFIGVYWFFIPLIGIYLVLPLFASIPKEDRINLFKYICVILFVCGSFIPFICNVFNIGFTLPSSILMLSTFIMFPLLGYLINEIDLDKKYRYCFYILGLLGLISHILGTFYLSYAAGEIIRTYKGFTNVPAIIYCIAIWILIKQLVSKHDFKITTKVVNFVKPYTFSIYLLHIYILMVLSTYFNTLSIWYRLLTPFIVIPICIMITYIIRKIKYLRYILPS